MRLVQVISNYIRQSILSTVGDFIVRGAAIPERLAAGALKTFLAGQGAGVIPAWEGHKLSDHGMVAGGFTISSATAYVTTGLGFRPSLIFFEAVDSVFTNLNFSLGMDNGTVRMGIFIEDMNTRAYCHRAWPIRIRRDGSNWINGTVTAISDDGFTFTTILTGACSMRIQWFAIE